MRHWPVISPHARLPLNPAAGIPPAQAIDVSDAPRHSGRRTARSLGDLDVDQVAFQRGVPGATCTFVGGLRACAVFDFAVLDIVEAAAECPAARRSGRVQPRASVITALTLHLQAFGLPRCAPFNRGAPRLV